MTRLWQGLVDPDVLDTPLVVVHRDLLQQNIEEMAQFSREMGVRLRPHLKTHKTQEIAALQLSAGAIGLTCSKLGEAEVFLEKGFRDILIAYPLVGAVKVRRLFDLIRRFPEATIETLVDSTEQLDALSQQAVAEGVTLPLWVKINSGLNRCGVLPGEEGVTLVEQVTQSPGIRYCGLLTHAGQSYGAASYEDVQQIGEHEANCLLQTADMLRQRGIETPGISVGSTPTVRISGRVSGVTEIRPGNYVFLDATQVRLGVAEPDRCALRVFARIVSRPAPDRAVIDAGAKTLALDKGAHGSDALSGYGTIVGQEKAVIERLSEEHGVVRLPSDSTLRVGDIIEILPNHSCPVANLTDELFVIGDDRQTERWSVIARGKTQ